jgi:hypothetical protein
MYFSKYEMWKNMLLDFKDQDFILFFKIFEIGGWVSNHTQEDLTKYRSKKTLKKNHVLNLNNEVDYVVMTI